MTFNDFVFVYGIVISIFISINCSFLISDIIEDGDITLKEAFCSFLESKGNPYIEKIQGKLNMCIWGFVLTFINWILIIIALNK